MAAVQTYVQEMRERITVIATKRGADLSQASKETRVLMLAVLTILATVVKVLVDKGLVTNQELNAALLAAKDDTYDDEPTETPAP